MIKQDVTLSYTAGQLLQPRHVTECTSPVEVDHLQELIRSGISDLVYLVLLTLCFQPRSLFLNSVERQQDATSIQYNPIQPIAIALEAAFLTI